MKKYMIFIFSLFISFCFISCNNDLNGLDEKTNNTTEEHKEEPQEEHYDEPNEVPNGEQPDIIDDNNKENNDNKQTEFNEPNLGNNNDPEVVETKVLSDFEVPSIINILIEDKIDLNVEYDTSIDVKFVLSTNSDILSIDGLCINAKKVGECQLIITEENSGLSKGINIIITPKINKYLNFYNGYYVFKECIETYNKTTTKKRTELFNDKKYIKLDDDIILNKINLEESMKEYDEVYLIGDTTNALFVKDGVLYGGVVFSWEKEYYYAGVFSLEYQYDCEIEEHTLNNQINLLNGDYIPGLVIYYKSGSGLSVFTQFQFMASFLIPVNDGITYVKTDINSITLNPTLNYIFSDIKLAKLDNAIEKEDIAEFYIAYENDAVTYALIQTNDDKYYYLWFSGPYDDRYSVMMITEMILIDDIKIND